MSVTITKNNKWVMTEVDIYGFSEFHVYYVDEPHIEDEICWCSPRRDTENPQVIIHNRVH